MYNWIADGTLVKGECESKYGPRPARLSRLDPFKGIIEARLQDYPQLSAVRLPDEIKAAGYTGGYDQVKRHALIVVPGYSRRMCRRFHRRQTLMVVIREIEEAFPCLGGVPAEYLFDRMRAVVVSDRRGAGGRLIENPELRGFAITGVSGSGPGDRTGLGRRGRSNSRSATSAVASLMTASLSLTTISTPRPGTGSTRWRTCACKGR